MWSTTLKYCDTKEWGRGRTAGGEPEKSNTIFSLAPSSRSLLPHSPQTQHALQENPGTLWYLSRSPEFVTFSTSLGDSVSLKLLSNINYSKILFLTFSTQMFLEWPCCRRGTTFPLNASPHSTFCLYFPGYFQTQHFHCHFAKNNHQLLKNSYPVSQNRHKNTPFLLASESTAGVQNWRFWNLFVNTGLADKYPDSTSISSGKTQCCKSLFLLSLSR